MRKWHVRSTQDPLEGRLPRIPTNTSLHYRLANEVGWRTGMLENISASGVMFRISDLDAQVERGTLLELEFVLPREIGGQSDRRVLSRAFAQRLLPGDGTTQRPAIAARINNLLPLDWVDPRER